MEVGDVVYWDSDLGRCVIWLDRRVGRWVSGQGVGGKWGGVMSGGGGGWGGEGG